MGVPTSSWLFLCLAFAGVAMVRWLEKTVMPCSPSTDPALWDLASPIAQVRPDAPPFFILHGTHDSLASVEEARHFAQQLRAVSSSAVVHAELPGAQHAWDMFRSARAMASVHAVTRFLEWARATRAQAATSAVVQAEAREGQQRPSAGTRNSDLHGHPATPDWSKMQ